MANCSASAPQCGGQLQENKMQYGTLESKQSLLQSIHASLYCFASLHKTGAVWVAGHRQKCQSFQVVKEIDSVARRILILYLVDAMLVFGA